MDLIKDEAGELSSRVLDELACAGKHLLGSSGGVNNQADVIHQRCDA